MKSFFPKILKKPGLVYRWSSPTAIQIHKSIGFKEVSPKVTALDFTLMSISKKKLKRACGDGIVKLFRNEMQQLNLDENKI